jgi:hypothetical protein
LPGRDLTNTQSRSRGTNSGFTHVGLIPALSALAENHIPDYRNLMTSYNTLTNGK